MPAAGRDPAHMKILPGALVIVADTVEEARRRRCTLDGLVHAESAIANLSMRLGTDASGFDPDGPLPDIPETNASKSARQSLIDLARREGLTVRQLAQRVGGFGGLTMVGDAGVDRGRDAGLAGGGGLRRVQRDVPLPARRPRRLRGPRGPRAAAPRGLFRREYEGTTLRGEPRPSSAAEPLLPGGPSGRVGTARRRSRSAREVAGRTSGGRAGTGRQSAMRRSCLPSLRPSNRRRRVAGAFSSPCCTSTWLLMRPSWTHVPSSVTASFARPM